MNKLKDRILEINRFLHDDLWKLDLSQYGFFKRTYYQTLKVLVLAAQHFKDDKLQLQASALTFFTLLSIVPLLAMAFGIAKGFGLDKELETQILTRFVGHEEVLETSLAFARNLLANTKGGLVAGVGLAFLFYTVMQLLGNIERSFNDIWYVTKQRPLTRKLTDYLTIMLLAPVLLVISNSLTIAITRQIHDLTETVSLLALFKGVIFPLLRLLPYIVIWILFTLVYLIMPNTNVSFKAGIVAGVISGSVFQFVQWVLIYFAVGVAEYNAIYGSFAALPLFLVWLQTSWLIVLVGAEISYAIQNVNEHEMSDDQQNQSIDSKKRLALSICVMIIRAFKEGKPAMTLHQINDQLGISDKVLHEVIRQLTQSGILSETKNLDDVTTYQPAQDTDRLDVATILSAFEQGTLQEAVHDVNEVTQLADLTIDSINKLVAKSSINKRIKDL